MKLEKTIQQFISENPEHRVLIKKAIEIYSEQFLYITQHTCAVCDKELSDEEIKSRANSDFHATCEEHRKFATMFYLGKVRAEFGLSPFNISNLDISNC
jgi:hypothetical protein